MIDNRGKMEILKIPSQNLQGKKEIMHNFKSNFTENWKSGHHDRFGHFLLFL